MDGQAGRNRVSNTSERPPQTRFGRCQPPHFLALSRPFPRTALFTWQSYPRQKARLGTLMVNDVECMTTLPQWQICLCMIYTNIYCSGKKCPYCLLWIPYSSTTRRKWPCFTPPLLFINYSPAARCHCFLPWHTRFITKEATPVQRQTLPSSKLTQEPLHSTSQGHSHKLHKLSNHGSCKLKRSWPIYKNHTWANHSTFRWQIFTHRWQSTVAFTVWCDVDLSDAKWDGLKHNARQYRALSSHYTYTRIIHSAEKTWMVVQSMPLVWVPHEIQPREDNASYRITVLLWHAGLSASHYLLTNPDRFTSCPFIGSIITTITHHVYQYTWRAVGTIAH